MQKNELAHRLELLLNSSSSQTPPDSTPCWDWISNKLLELAAKAKNPDVKLRVDIYFKKDGSAVCYTLCKELLDEIDKEEQDFNFTLEETKACQVLADYNGVKYTKIYKPEPKFERLIAFIY